ncbi:MAG: o-succinylbenzoate synthase [Cyclobacteriaceae bacterium]
MALKISHKKYCLKFNFEAGTSRGVMKDRDIYILTLSDSRRPQVTGLGECAPLPGLSIEYGSDYEEVLDHVCRKMEGMELPESLEVIPTILNQYVTQKKPSIFFGFEMAFRDLLKGGNKILFDSAFTQGKESLPINGLIWMGDHQFMREQIEEKVQAGYTCLKMKVGAIDFSQELELLSYLRQLAPEAIIRIDANGAFREEEATEKLDQLAHLKIHSIEQPLAPGQGSAMRRLCQTSPISIALDEELIGVVGLDGKKSLLEEIKPLHIVLKPTLLGGFQATKEWIKLAKGLGIGWWITSALESNIGLNAISQFTASLPYIGHQGLGTGQLYSNNFGGELRIEMGYLHYDR